MGEKIICPVCGADNNKIFVKKNGHILRVCKVCRLIFVWPIPKNLEEIYKKEYFKGSEKKDFGYTNYDEDKEPMKNIFIFYLKKFKRLVSGRRIFDIGAATGYFLDLARDRGWQTAGVEISKYASDIAKFKKHEIYNNSSLGDFHQHKFDVVTMWDVLEHLQSPKEYLKNVNKILNQGGVLAINTVDAGSWWAKLFGKKWHQLNPPEHLFYFSKNNLKLLLKNSGFKVLEKRKISKKFSLTYVFKVLHNWQGLKIWQKLERFFNKSFWRKFYLPINLRDNIFILAKKYKELD